MDRLNVLHFCWGGLMGACAVLGPKFLSFSRTTEPWPVALMLRFIGGITTAAFATIGLSGNALVLPGGEPSLFFAGCGLAASLIVVGFDPSPILRLHRKNVDEIPRVFFKTSFTAVRETQPHARPEALRTRAHTSSGMPCCQTFARHSRN